MIAKITRGSNPGNIGAYLHGPGKANEHVFKRGGKTRPGGVVIGGNLGADGQSDPKIWVKEMRAAMRTRPEITKPIWQVSLRNTAEDRTLSDAEWRDVGQSFAEQMGFEEHPWAMVRHGDDHVHIVLCRISDAGQVWHGRNDRRAAQAACTALEREHGLTAAPRRRERPQKRSQAAERAEYRQKAQNLAKSRQEPAQGRSAARRGLDAEEHAAKRAAEAMGVAPIRRNGPRPESGRVRSRPELRRDRGIGR